MTDVPTYRVLFVFENGQAGECEAFEYQGRIWLVPTWIGSPDKGYASPARMIPIDQFRYQKIKPTTLGINDPIPREIFDGHLTQQLKDKFSVIEKPDIKMKTGGALH